MTKHVQKGLMGGRYKCP